MLKFKSEFRTTKVLTVTLRLYQFKTKTVLTLKETLYRIYKDMII